MAPPLSSRPSSMVRSDRRRQYTVVSVAAIPDEALVEPTQPLSASPISFWIVARNPTFVSSPKRRGGPAGEGGRGGPGEEHAPTHGEDREEIEGDQVPDVVGEEGPPGLGRRGCAACLGGNFWRRGAGSFR